MRILENEIGKFGVEDLRVVVERFCRSWAWFEHELLVADDGTECDGFREENH
jgi:hypothetical protein